MICGLFLFRMPFKLDPRPVLAPRTARIRITDLLIALPGPLPGLVIPPLSWRLSGTPCFASLWPLSRSLIEIPRIGEGPASHFARDCKVICRSAGCEPDAIDAEVAFMRRTLGAALGRKLAGGYTQFDWGEAWARFDPKGFMASSGIRYRPRR
ncbi:hypothetical protein [Stenotrophomonas sp. RAC2]|uniref:hypothetical protein n=1 Tax=Stenotrophomonas sp. RAC2 TaxID=3064902 RepID=UPI00271ED2D4|nr:hypothetical protein [Stenotrophomonas sp. RAC2]MDV9040737.1 hypothetical protein [Stenotrophomonas sp. RAC2]